MFIPATYELFETNGDGFAITRHSDGSLTVSIVLNASPAVSRRLQCSPRAGRDEAWFLLDYCLHTGGAIEQGVDYGILDDRPVLRGYWSEMFGLGLEFEWNDTDDVSVWLSVRDLYGPRRSRRAQFVISRQALNACTQVLAANYPRL